MYIYSKSVHTNACINILRCFGYPREHNFGLVLILSPTGCTEGCVYFPQSCRNTHLPHFLDCLLNTTLIPCLLVCFLSHNTSRTSLRLQRSTKFSNRHTAHGRYEYSYNLANSRENWAQKKKSLAGPVMICFRRHWVWHSASQAEIETESSVHVRGGPALFIIMTYAAFAWYFTRPKKKNPHGR